MARANYLECRLLHQSKFNCVAAVGSNEFLAEPRVFVFARPVVAN
jgi:hypothetical protein